MNPEFFIVRGSTSADIFVIVLIVAFLVPSFLILSEWFVSRFKSNWEKNFHSFILFIVFSLFVVIPLNRSLRTPWTIAISCTFLISGLFVIGYRRYASIRMFIGFLIPSILIVPGLFLMHDSISKLITNKDFSVPNIEISSSTPVVLVIFDEFPLSSILKDQFTIDAVHFPNFARLAETTTWYRNATAVSDFTSYAVPSIVSGEFPKTMDLPIIDDHPQNLFTTLGRTYELKVIEGGERLLPKEAYRLKDRTEWSARIKSMILDLALLYAHMVIPKDVGAAGWLPPVDQAWGNFWGRSHDTTGETDRVLNFLSFVEAITPTEKPTLFYVHSLLPHDPWQYLPSGKRKDCQFVEEKGKYYLHRYECHLLQVGAVDRLVGILLERLRTTRIYDQCLLIITADHGISFRIGRSRRGARSNNYQDIVLVPLFIKTPHQEKGAVNDLNVSNMDILPTIADILRVQLPWVQGISVFDPSIKNRTSKRFFSTGKHEEMKFESLMPADPETLRVRESVMLSLDSSWKQ